MGNFLVLSQEVSSNESFVNGTYGIMDGKQTREL